MEFNQLDSLLVFVLAAVLAMLVGWSFFGREGERKVPPAPPPDEGEAGLKLVPADFVVVGLVTTGPDVERDSIVELAAIRSGRDALVHASFEALVRPGAPLPPELVARTGIDDAMLAAHGIAAGDAIRGFRRFVGDLPLVARDLDMVLAFIDAALAAEGLGRLANAATCTLKLARDGAAEGRLEGAPDDSPEHRALAECKRALMAYMASAITHAWH